MVRFGGNTTQFGKMDQQENQIIRDSASGFHGTINNGTDHLDIGVVGNSMKLMDEKTFIELPQSAYFDRNKAGKFSFWAYNQDGELSNRTLLHANSAAGDHLKILLPGSDGAFIG